LLLVAVVGIGNSLEDVAGFTLLQRLVADDVLGRVLGVLWGVAMAGVGIGSVLAPALVDALGARGALVGVGLLLPLLTVLAWPRLLAIDAATGGAASQLAFLSRVPMFAPLSVAAKEFVASSLIPLTASPGTEIIRQGDGGDRFYIVVEGEAEVTRDGRHIVDRGPGEYFGEIALLRSVPRTATVTARTPTELYGLDRDDFLAAVTGHSAGRAAGEAVVVERLATLEPPPAPTPPG
jgi:hypothetical protein